LLFHGDCESNAVHLQDQELEGALDLAIREDHPGRQGGSRIDPNPSVPEDCKPLAWFPYNFDGCEGPDLFHPDQDE
jgi:hypothetical protein